MGAVICGMETEHLMVQGVKRLHDSVWKIEGDRIVAGTYSTAVMAAGGNISLKEVNTKQLKLPLELLRKAGANVREEEFSLHISMKDRPKAFLCAQDLIRSSLRIFNPLLWLFLHVPKERAGSGSRCLRTVSEQRQL